MKLIKEMKKESGINFNLASEFQSEKALKLKFEPNVNLKRNFVPKPELEKIESTEEQQQNIININQSKIYLFINKTSQLKIRSERQLE